MKRCFVLSLSLLVVLPVFACQTAEPRHAEIKAEASASRAVSAETVLPERFAGNWVAAAPGKVFIGQDLYNRINGAAELFLEMGFRRLTAQRYHHGEGVIDLELYEMENPTAALGVYSHKRGRETPLEGLPGRHTGNRFQITACKGGYFFQVNNFAGGRDLLPAMVELARSVFGAIPEGNPVDLLDILPEGGLVAGSELIVRGPHSLRAIAYLGEGDILQLGGSVFGIAGDYVTGDGERFTLLVIPYGQRAAAMAAYQNLRGHLDPYLTVIRQDEQELVFRNPNNECGQVTVVEDGLEVRVHLSCSKASSLG